MIVIFGGPLVLFVLCIFVARHLAHQFGWGAVVCGLLSVPFWAMAWFCVFFPEVQVLALLGTFVGVLLLGAALTLGHEYLPNRARRIAERQQRAVEWRAAEAIVQTESLEPSFTRAQMDWMAYGQRKATNGGKRRIEPTF